MKNLLFSIILVPFIVKSQRNLTVDTSDRSKQYYQLLEEYKHGKKDSAMLRSLALTALSLEDMPMATAIAKDFKDNYLNRLDVSAICTKENLDFIMQFQKLINSKDIFFNLFYYYGDKADKVMGIKGYSQRMVDYIITKEEIDSKLYGNSNSEKTLIEKPGWNKLKRTITKKYNRIYAERTVINAQIKWYKYKKDWSRLLACNLKKIDKYGIDTAGMGKYLLNDMIWESIFEHSNDKEVLKKGIEWMELILKSIPGEVQAIDTYANLLYKVGRTNEALNWEEKAAELEEENAIKSKRIPDKVFKETLAKMQNGEATWPKE